MESNAAAELRGPRRVIWEITWRCDLRCPHCLVSAGGAARSELEPAEALAVVPQLAALGARIVTLTGGEPLLRRDWGELAAAIRSWGMALRLSTNGHGVDDQVVRQLTALAVDGVVVSLDGLRTTHDGRRTGGVGPSSFDRVLACLERVRAAGIRPAVITTVGADNLDELPALHRLLKERGVRTWQVQLAWRAGRAVDGFELLPPERLPALAGFLRRASEDGSLPPRVHNSIGYLSADEPLLRASGRRRAPPWWPGCRCGVESIAIEPDGGVKGCASQVGAPFVVGNLRDEPLATIWADRERWHWLRPDRSQLSGRCGECALGELCGAGCTALALASSGALFDNRMCLRRHEGSPE